MGERTDGWGTETVKKKDETKIFIIIILKPWMQKNQEVACDSLLQLKL